MNWFVAGLTIKPNADGVVPSIAIGTLKECNTVSPSLPKSVKLVDIKQVQPAISVVRAQPDLMAGGNEFGEKKCGVYTKEEGKMTLCLQSVSQWGSDVVQVNGFLENSGGISLCDVKIQFEEADIAFSAWPEWARVNQWENDFAPKQSTAVGLTAPAKPDGSYPHITLVNFNICGKKSATPPTLEVVDLADVKRTGTEGAANVNSRRLAVREYVYISPSQANDKRRLHTAEASGRRLAASKNPFGSSREEAKRRLQAPQLSKPVAATASRPIKAGECGVYKNGKAELELCIESVVQWGSAIQQVSGHYYATRSNYVKAWKLCGSQWLVWYHHAYRSTLFWSTMAR